MESNIQTAPQYTPDLFPIGDKHQFDKWMRFHKDNPHVWKHFSKYAFLAINAGRKHYSHWIIINLIRWDYEIHTKSGDFKIDNNHIAYYARLFEAAYPQHVGFFKLRQLKKP